MLAFLTSIAATASLAEGIGRIPSVTRLVHVFFQAEGKLSEAVKKRDMAAVSNMLSDDFEMRVGAMPGTPVPRAAWIQQSFAQPESSMEMEQMAVHGFGKIAIVSFLWKVGTAKSKMVHDVFIVDTWRQVAGAWKLVIRYAAPATPRDYPIPGVPMTPPVFEKRE
jgi:ketosteroid isomerase-like protein